MGGVWLVAVVAKLSLAHVRLDVPGGQSDLLNRRAWERRPLAARNLGDVVRCERARKHDVVPAAACERRAWLPAVI